MIKLLLNRIDRLLDEEMLSAFIGDIPAYYGHAIFKRSLRQVARMREAFMSDLKDYCIEEAHCIVGRVQFAARLDAISTLSQETETLSARFHAIKIALQELAV